MEQRAASGSHPSPLVCDVRVFSVQVVYPPRRAPECLRVGPVANSLGAWGRATSLTGSGLEGMSEAREIY